VIQTSIYDKDKHIAMLEATNTALAEKLAYLNKRKMAKNGEQATKWRDSAFYYKRRCKALIDWIEGLGLEVPKLGGEDGKIRDSSES